MSTLLTELPPSARRAPRPPSPGARAASRSSATRTPARPRSSTGCAARAPRPRTFPARRPRRASAARRWPASSRCVQAEIVDLPGVYRLSLNAPESAICRDVLLGEGLYRKPDAVVVVVDACNLTRNLVLVGELLAFDEPVVVALNMVDLAQRRGLTPRRRALAARARLSRSCRSSRAAARASTRCGGRRRRARARRVAPADRPATRDRGARPTWADSAVAAQRHAASARAPTR